MPPFPRPDSYVIAVQPPLGGVSKRVGYQNQPPFTSYKSINYWSIDVQSGRLVTASRPPLVAFTSPAGTGPVNFMARVNGVAVGKPLQSMVASRDGTLYWWDGSSWVAATGAQASSIPDGVQAYGAAQLQVVYIAQFGAAPIAFDYVTGAAATLVASAGTVPTDMRMFASWQGSLWGAGQLDSPHILYGSRTGDATNWDFAVPLSDKGGAFFTGGENEGLLRGPITAIFAHTTDTMVVSTVEGLTAMRAHPRRGGVFENIGGDYILGQGAWCKGPDDTAYFLTRLGMAKLAPGDRSVADYISRDKIPEDLMGLAYDYELPNINMKYCSRWNSIYITVRGLERQQSWRYDLQSGAFEQMQFDEYPWSMMEFFPAITENTSDVLWGMDSGIRYFDRLGVESYDSELWIGPIRMSPDQTAKSFLVSGNIVFGGSTPTSPGTIEIAVGADAEDAVQRMESGNPQYRGNLEDVANQNGKFFPRLTGAAMVIRLFQPGE